MRVYQSMPEMIGHTPLIELHRWSAAYGISAHVLGKLELMNPCGSVKDRAALAMIERAEQEGKLQPGVSTIIEPTSGNTGIGLAAIGAAKGYRVILTMPNTMSIERRMLLGAYGATLILTDSREGMEGAIRKAHELALATPHSFIPDQFSNPANPEVNYHTTGREIWEDTDGKVDILVAGVGTGGTLTGVGRYLKERKKNLHIVAVEPARSPMFSKGESGVHGIQGIGSNFIPEVLDTSLMDEIIPVYEEDAYEASRKLARHEGILAGMSAGAALHALSVLGGHRDLKDQWVVVMLPDTGERYLSTELYVQ